MEEQWTSELDEESFKSAIDYLGLLIEPDIAREIAEALRAEPTVIFSAEELLRASHLVLLPSDHRRVSNCLRQIANGEKFSPALLIRGDFIADIPLMIADGYDRICASYSIDVTTPIQCRIVTWPR